MSPTTRGPSPWATRRRDVLVVLHVDFIRFCLRNGADEMRQWRARAALAAAVAAGVGLMLATAAGAGIGTGLGAVAAELHVSHAAGLLVVVAGIHGLATAASGLGAGNRLAAWNPADLPVLRALDVGIGASILCRAVIPRALRSAAWGVALAAAVLTAPHDGGLDMRSGTTAVITALLPATGTVAFAALVCRPLRRRGSAVGLLSVAVVAAACAGVLAAMVVNALRPADAEEQVRRAVGSLTAVGEIGSVAPVPAAVLCLAVLVAFAMRLPPQLLVLDCPPALPLSPAPRRYRAVRALRRWSWSLVPLLTAARSPQRHAALLRRGTAVTAVAGVGLCGLGLTLNAPLTHSGRGLDAVSGAGALFAIAVVTASLIAAVAGPGVLAGALRWAVEQGADPRRVAARLACGLLVVTTAGTCVPAVGLALITGDGEPVLFTAALTMAATASAIAGGLVGAGRQINPDGSAEAGLAGVLVGLAFLGLPTLPWILDAPRAPLLGIVTGAAALVLAATLTARRLAR